MSRVGKQKTLIAYYGNRHQIVKAIEEFSELIVELTKYLDKPDNRPRVIEEFSDVINMVDQLGIIFNIDSDVVQNLIHSQLDRALSRVEEDKK